MKRIIQAEALEQEFGAEAVALAMQILEVEDEYDAWHDAWLMLSRWVDERYSRYQNLRSDLNNLLTGEDKDFGAAGKRAKRLLGLVRKYNGDP